MPVSFTTSIIIIIIIVSNFLFWQTDAKALTTLAEKNSFCAARWRALSTEEKVKYERQAEELKKGTGVYIGETRNQK